MAPIIEIARAKVNLTLTVHGRRPDGYHEIESLVAFAEDVADRVVLDPEGEIAVRTAGPFAAFIVGENLVATAIDILRRTEPRLALGTVTLEKNLPVASGLGGGSANAAAVLRAVRRVNPAFADAIDWDGIACALGADVPVCLESRASIMRGKGEDVSPLEELPPLFAVLVNPMVAVPAGKTARVFRLLGAGPLGAGVGPTMTVGASPPPRITSGAGSNLPHKGGGTASHPRLGGSPRLRRFGEDPGPSEPNASVQAQRGPSPLVGEVRACSGLDPGRGGITALAFGDFLAAHGNDLETPARTLIPEIAQVIEAIRQTPSCSVARLSGAGPTCFGLFEDRAAAQTAAHTLRHDNSAWWVQASNLR